MPLSSEVKSNVTKSTAVDLGSISASSRVMFLYCSDSQVYLQCGRWRRVCYSQNCFRCLATLSNSPRHEEWGHNQGVSCSWLVMKEPT